MRSLFYDMQNGIQNTHNIYIYTYTYTVYIIYIICVDRYPCIIMSRWSTSPWLRIARIGDLFVSGKRLHHHGKIHHFSMGKSTIKINIRGIPGLVNIQKAIGNGHRNRGFSRYIHSDFPQLCGCLPEGIPQIVKGSSTDVPLGPWEPFDGYFLLHISLLG